MQTLIHLRFTGPSVAFVQQQLRAANCGPDVVTLNDEPFLKQVFVDVTLDQADQRVALLLERLARDAVDWSSWQEDRHTEEEKERAPLLLIHPNGGCEVSGGVKWGTTFEPEGGCPACATGCRQTSALFIDGEDIPSLEGHRAAQTYFWHLLVDEGIVASLAEANVTGLSLRSVYGVLPDKRQIKLRWKQLDAEHILPKMSPHTTGLVRREQSEVLRPCKVCGRNGYGLMAETPVRVTYRAADLRGALDVNQTWENYWSACVDPDFRQSVLSRPWTVITPKVYRIFREAGVTELDFHPIRIEDG